MGGFLKYLGFALPNAIAMSSDANPPRDKLPVAGRCYLCKRDRAVCYRAGDGGLVCWLCLDGNTKSLEKRRWPSRARSVAPVIPEPVTGELAWDVGERLLRFDQKWWDRQIA